MIDIPIWTSFADRAADRPGATALVWRDEKVTYEELHQLALRAHFMIDRMGVGPREIVGLPATKSPTTIAVVLACLRARRPVMLPSSTLPAATLDRLFQRAGCRHIVRPDDLAPGPEDAGELDTDIEHGTMDLGTGESAAGEAVPGASGEDVAFILTTSGSTGLPKLVPLAAGAVERFTGWASQRFGIAPGTTVLNYAPLNFDLCFLDVWTTLQRGGTVVLVDPDAATNGDHLLGLVADHEVHVLQAVPMCYRLMLDAAGDEPDPLGSVRHVAFTGDHMPLKTLAELPRLFPLARLTNIYGCTETNDSFLHEVDPADMPRSAVPLGSPLPGVQALIIDDDGAVVEGEGRGELLVATPFQTSGYLGRLDGAGDDGVNGGDGPRVSAGPSPNGPFVDLSHHGRQERFFRTGDIVRRDRTGRVHFEGRNDFQIKVRGTRINTSEVEQALLEHDAVLEAAVIAVPDPLAGHLLHSVVRRAPGTSLNSLALRQHCAERLTRAAVPSVLRLTDEPLPKTSTGKVDRRAFELAATPPNPSPTA